MILVNLVIVVLNTLENTEVMQKNALNLSTVSNTCLSTHDSNRKQQVLMKHVGERRERKSE